MNKEEAIESFKYSNEQAKVRLEVEKMRMDMDEVKELEFYIERDEMAIKALEQMPVTTTTGGEAVIYYPQVEGVTPTVVDTGKQDPCDTCGYEEGSIYCKEHCPHEAKIDQDLCEDAISRQAVLKIIDGWYENNRDTENIEDLIILITYMASVKSQPKSECEHDHEILKAYSDGASAVLDNVRAEIEERKLNSGGEPNRELAFNVCLQIIDNYAEEDKA